MKRKNTMNNSLTPYQISRILSYFGLDYSAEHIENDKALGKPTSVFNGGTPHYSDTDVWDYLQALRRKKYIKRSLRHYYHVVSMKKVLERGYHLQINPDLEEPISTSPEWLRHRIGPKSPRKGTMLPQS